MALTDEDIAAIVAAVQAVSGGIIEAQEAAYLYIRKGDTWVQNITNLGNLAGKEIVWIMKESLHDSDDDAIVKITESGGLVRLNGAAAGTSGWGSVTILDSGVGNIRLRLESDATVLLKSMTYEDGVKLLEDGLDITPRTGKTVVQRAASQTIS